jgi:hypothetical protein
VGQFEIGGTLIVEMTFNAFAIEWVFRLSSFI